MEDLFMNRHKNREAMETANSKGFWQWCTILRITKFLDFVHQPVFHKLQNTTFWKLDLFLSSCKETPTLLGPLGWANLNIEVISFWGQKQIQFLKRCIL
jgi:hypothetical protein